MKRSISQWLGVALAALASSCGMEPTSTDAVRWVTLDPGHFHAALVHREMTPGVDPLIRIYAPLGPELFGHLERISAFNSREAAPTGWRLSVFAGPDYLERFIEEKAGDVVLISGKNREKLEAIRRSVDAGYHVLADKPWILETSALGKLQEVLQRAQDAELVVMDAMTQRYDVAYRLQREIVADPTLLGPIESGTPQDPAVHIESLHYILKTVAGRPNRRPTWFFDTAELGEGLTDVGTHLVDLVQWTLATGESLVPGEDVVVLESSHWPTPISRADFERVTGEVELPANLQDRVEQDALAFLCNNEVTYKLRGIHVRLVVRWDFEAPPQGEDTEVAVYRGRRGGVEVRKDASTGYRPELSVLPAGPRARGQLAAALEARVRGWSDRYPGLRVEEDGERLLIVIPDALRTGHEEHFALLTRRFLDLVRDPSLVPPSEAANLLAKYYVTTTGVELARVGAPEHPEHPEHEDEPNRNGADE